MPNYHLDKKDYDPIKFLENIESTYNAFNNYIRVLFDRNILKFMGKHWIELPKKNSFWRSSAYYYQRTDKNYPMPVTNYVFDKVFTVKSNLIKMFPTAYATHRVRSRKAEWAAHCLDTAIKYYHDSKRLKFTDKIDRTAGWTLLTGGCIMVPYWNLNTGKYIIDYEMEMKPTTDENGNPRSITAKVCLNCGNKNNEMTTKCERCGSTSLSKEQIVDIQMRELPIIDNAGNPKIKEKVPIGEPGLEIAPYYEWTFDLRYDELEDCPFLVRERLSNIESVKNKYNTSAEIIPDTFVPEGLKYKQRINSWIGGGILSDFASDVFYKDNLSDACIEKDLWIKPQNVDDDGMHYVIVGKKVVHKEKFREQGTLWEEGNYPFFHVRYAKVPGKMHGKSFVDDIIVINDMINRLDQMVEWNRRNLDSILITYARSGVNVADLWSKLGRHVTINDVGQEPRFIQPPALPEQVYVERDRRVEDIHRMSISEPFSGKIESRIPIAALNMALEQSSSKLTEFYVNMLNGSVFFWDSVRIMLQEYLTTKRAFSIIGKEDEFEAVEFIGSDLRGDEKQEDGGVMIKIQHDDIYPQSRAALKQMIIEGLKGGTFVPQDPFNQAIVNKILGLEKEGLNRSFDSNEVLAKREILYMNEGVNITEHYQQMYQTAVHPAENSAIHLEVHSRHILSAEFDKLPYEVQMYHLIHYTETQKIVQANEIAKAEQQMNMGMALKGSPVKTQI